MIAHQKTGKLAREAGFNLPISVMKSAAGFYLGTADESGPVSRESEYFATRDAAQNALDSNSWCQNWDI
ncbi:hypothetical protein ACI2KR_27185 [Pseudomonas luteola]